ncbi:MAG: hypothetical protein CVV27_09750 [Candidatus Melainabacteria bacterium HGW-Melainabacteria-1]|nr:MAG: hypothetical protein CVV27_09750 [Candidatus Melainabacteria bacterium HGW-Melainabacteria-1]
MSPHPVTALLPTQLPLSLAAPTRHRLLKGGEILKLPATELSLALCEKANGLLRKLLGSPYPESLHEIWSPARLHQAFGAVRRQLHLDPDLRQGYLDLLASLELDLNRTAIDQPRLRAVIPGVEAIPAATPMFYAHRDTWYANSPSQINLWIPLADYPASQTFVFWPERFARAIPNDSAEFDYIHWKANAGFQNPSPAAGSAFPRALELPAGPPTGFDCRQGELLLFAAAHLHMSQPNPGPAIRYSLDLRLVCQDDLEQGLRAPDPDNRSKGSTLPDYNWLDTAR